MNSCRTFLSFFLLLFIILINLPNVFGQRRVELEKKRKNLNDQIRYTTTMLEKAKQERQSTIVQLTALQEQIRAREALLRTINEEIYYIDQSIERGTQVIEALEKDLAQIKEGYQEMLRAAYRDKNTNNELLFVFSASSLNEAMVRWRYLKSYNEYRKKQALLITSTQRSLETKVKKLEQRKIEKENLRLTEIQQNRLLDEELQTHNRLLQKLKSQSSQLERDLAAKKKAREDLIAKLEQALKEEFSRSNNTNTPTRALNPAEEKTGQRFAELRGKLPWPVVNGVISSRFGERPHPLNNQLVDNNTGIDIATDNNAEIRTVCAGKVVHVFFQPSFQNAIIIRHGRYYTVYSNMGEVFVKSGDQVRDKQAIGTVHDKELHFEVWEHKLHQDPQQWLSRK